MSRNRSYFFPRKSNLEKRQKKKKKGKRGKQSAEKEKGKVTPIVIRKKAPYREKRKDKEGGKAFVVKRGGGFRCWSEKIATKRGSFDVKGVVKVEKPIGGKKKGGGGGGKQSIRFERGDTLLRGGEMGGGRGGLIKILVSSFQRAKKW